MTKKFIIVTLFVVLLAVVFYVVSAKNRSASRKATAVTEITDEQSSVVFVSRYELLQYDAKEASWGIAVGDADDDGDADIWVTQHGVGSAILLNRLNEDLGKFEKIYVPPPGDQHGVAWADLDRDGKREVIVLLGGGKGGKVKKPLEMMGNRIYVNQSSNGREVKFVFPDSGRKESDSRGLCFLHGRGRTPTLIDVNGDGLLDVFIGNGARSDGAYPSTIFIQQSDNAFTNRGDKLGVKGNGLLLAVPADFNGDGRMDLFLMGNRTENKMVVGRDQQFEPSDIPLPDDLRKAKADDVIVADYNGDLRPDIWVVKRKVRTGKGGRDLLFLGTPSGFVNVSAKSGVSKYPFNSRNAVAGDFDNDGDIDVYAVNSGHWAFFVGENLPNVLWENTGNVSKAEEPENIPTPVFVPRVGPRCAPSSDNGLGTSVAMGEFNGDGVLDLIVANGAKLPSQCKENPGLFIRGTYDLYFGVANKNAWLMVDLVGTVSNTEGIGAVVLAIVNGKTQLRTADHGVHSKTHNDPRLHFGFGTINPNDKVTLKITWPSGILQEVRDIPPNQVIKVSEPKPIAQR